MTLPMEQKMMMIGKRMYKIVTLECVLKRIKVSLRLYKDMT